MAKKPYEYARGRFILDTSKVIDVAVYHKQQPGKDNPSDYTTVWRVAYTLDVQNTEKNTLYSDAFNTEDEARAWAQRPLQQD